MPRGRMLNKKISYDQKVSSLSLKSKLLFTWIIPHLDVKGRFFAESSIIKGQVCPFVKELSLKNIDNCLMEIQQADLIVLYQVEGHKYLEYKGFSKNQTITESRESPSEIPDYTQAQLIQNSSITQGEVNISKDNINLNISKEKATHPLQLWIKNNLPEVSRLENQLTETECEKLLAEYPDQMIRTVLNAMENYKPLLKKYKSVNLTLRNWLKRENSNATRNSPRGTIQIDKFAAELATVQEK